MFATAAKVTTPLAMVQVPWFATVKLPVVMQLLVFAGFTMQLEVSDAEPCVAKAPAPESMSVNATLVFGSKVLVCGVAVGAVGAATVGVIVAVAFCANASTTAYLIAVAVPENVGKGVKVTVEPLSVYVPWFAIVRVVSVQLAAGVETVAQRPTMVTPAGSLVSGVIVCAVFQAPLFVSFTATGAEGGDTVGV